MSEKRKETHDGLQRIEVDQMKIRKTTVKSTASSPITVNLPSSSGTLALVGGGISNPLTIGLTSLQASAVSPNTLQLPTATGTLATTSDLSTYVTTNTTQTIGAKKAFQGELNVSNSGTYPRTSNSNQRTSTFTDAAVQLSSNSNCGLYASDTEILNLGTGGTNYISLQPQGIFRFSGGTLDPAVVFNERIQAMNGASSATSPAIQIDNQNSGFYRVSQGVLGIGISGAAIGRWSATGLNLSGVAGTAAAPALVLANDTTTGLYRPIGNQIGVSCSGGIVARFSTGNVSVENATLNVTTGTITYAPSTTTGAAISSATQTCNDSTTAASGTATRHAQHFFGRKTLTATNSNVTYTDSHNVFIAGPPLAGTNVTLTNRYALGIDWGSIIHNNASGNGGQIIWQPGAASLPAYSFLNDTNTGIYTSGADNIDFSTGGTRRLNISNTGVALHGATFKTTLVQSATADRTITFPDATGTVVLNTTLPEIQSGEYDEPNTIAAGGIDGPNTVNFLSAFSSTPRVIANGFGALADQCGRLVVTIHTVSTTSFTFSIANLNSSGTASNISVLWIATSAS